MEEIVFSVSEYIDLINETLKTRKITIQGEITSFNSRGGAVFFTIADKEEEAILECVIWKSVFDNLGIELAEGLEVKITGIASIYKKNGRFRFIASTIIPIGEGALRKAFERLKQRLQEAGYFDQDRKKELPEYITNIGLITAKGSDAKKDFETHIGKFGFRIFFYDVKVEGTNCIKEITSAFNWFNEHPMKLDAIVLTRGGGSLESLMAFNSEDVAKAIYKSRIPVISAVGHENDITIADLVADLRASTPTHAGKIISQPYIDVQTKLMSCYSSIKNNLEISLRQHNEQITRSGAELVRLFNRQLERYSNLIATYQRNQIMAFRNVLENFKQLENHIFNAVQLVHNEIVKRTDFVNFSEKLLLANDPRHKLKQGYTIATNKSGKIIKSVNQLQEKEILVTQFYDGISESDVTKIQKL